MIYLIITTSVFNKSIEYYDYEQRKQTYLENIRNTLKMCPSTIKPIIVENNNLSESYLDILDCDVCYTDNNRLKYHHKGVNEMMDIQSVIDRYDIQDEDMIIKITGRYTLLNDSFFQTLHNEADAFFKFFSVWGLVFIETDCVMGLWAVRCKYLRDFQYVNFHHKSGEMEFAEFANSIQNKVCLKELGLRCCFADDFRVIDV